MGYRILSIDGGGIRGIIPARVLAHIENETGRPIASLFDGIAGTSTGAVLALALGRNGARFGSAAEIVELYRSEGTAIFRRTWKDRFLSAPSWLAGMLDLPTGVDMSDLWEPRYGEGRRAVFERHFAGLSLSDTSLDILIPTYDIELRCPVLLVSNPKLDAQAPFYEATSKVSMVDALCAATAAPTYFPPHSLERRHEGRYALVDGSVFAANPTALAQTFLAPQQPTITLSLGTGATEHPFQYKQARRWGAVRWAGPLLSMLMDGQCESVHLNLQRRASPYLRLQSLLGDFGASDALDDCRPTTIEALERLADALIAKHHAELDLLCADLLRS